MAGWSLDHAYVWHVYAMIGKLTRRSYPAVTFRPNLT